MLSTNIATTIGPLDISLIGKSDSYDPIWLTSPLSDLFFKPVLSYLYTYLQSFKLYYTMFILCLYYLLYFFLWIINCKIIVIFYIFRKFDGTINQFWNKMVCMSLNKKALTKFECTILVKDPSPVTFSAIL